MMRHWLHAMAATAALGGLAGPVAAQDMANSPVMIVDFVTGPCLLSETGDIATTFAALKQAVRQTGLPRLVADSTTGIYGDPSGFHIIVTAGSDSLTCVISIPASVIDHVGFEVLETVVTEEFDARLPGYKTSASDDPSPDVDGREWVIDTAAGDHIAAALSFATEDGVQFSSVAQKKYE